MKRARKVRQFMKSEGLSSFLIEANTWSDEGTFSIDITDGYSNNVYLDEASFDKLAKAVAAFREKFDA